MSRSKPANLLTRKPDLIHLAILLLIALGIGVYMIATTVVITKDGVWYIEQAKKFSSSPRDVIKGQPFGFPFLIFITYQLIASFSNNSSLFTWIYSAQSITLLCRLLALIPLYFIGKLLIGSKRSFRAILILIFLPYPAQFASEALREWPHILFLASGFLFLFWGVKHGKWWLFGAAGFAAGLGHTIRPECAQLIIYGALWIFIRLISPKPEMSRPRLLCALSVLLIGFAIPAAPYMTATGQFLPAKLKALFSVKNEELSILNSQFSILNSQSASVMPGKILKAIGELTGAVSENLMYYFLPALLIGIYFRFRKKSSATEIEKFFMPAFAALNVVMLIALYYNWEYISRRHCLPLVVFTIFYVPIGLQKFADFIANRFSKSGTASDEDCRRWFFILLIIGLIICLPKLLSRPGSDKPGYRTAAIWLKEHTNPDDLIAVPDRRITFYAERKEFIYETAFSGKADYVVIIAKWDTTWGIPLWDENEVPDFLGNTQKQYSAWENERKNKKIVIYKMLQ